MRALAGIVGAMVLFGTQLASADRLSANGQVIQFSGLVARSATTPDGTISKGNGNISFARGTLKRSGDQVVLSFRAKRAGLRGFVPFLRWERIKLTGTLREDSDKVTRVVFRDSLANRLQLKKTMKGKAEVTTATGELSLRTGPTGATTLDFRNTVELSVPNYGSVSFESHHTGDDIKLR